MRKIILLSVILCLSVVSVCADEGSRVKTYYVGMLVHANNSYDIYEEITARFDTPHHGIYRYVPQKYYLDGKGHPVDVTDLAVEGDMYSLEEENQNQIIKIGDPDKEITGEKTYAISYKMANYDDRDTSRDLFYHSILGSDFKLNIDTLSFTIVFEKGLPKYATDSLQIFSGEGRFKKNALNAEVWIEGDTIFGTVANIPAQNAVTLYLPMKEGYYTGVKTFSPTLTYIFLAITVLLLAIIIFYGVTVKRLSVTKQIEFYPPEGLCSAEVGKIIDDSSDNIDIASLIPWYASEGYLNIEEKEEKGIIGKSKYLEIHKLKDASDKWKEYQKTFFNALFSSDKTSVRLDKLPKMPKSIENTINQLDGLFEGEHELTDMHGASFLEIPLWIVSTLLFIAAMPCSFFADDDYLLILLLWTLPYACGYFFVISDAASRLFEKQWIKITFFIGRVLLMLICMALQLWLLDEPIISKNIVIAIYIATFISVELCARLILDTKYRVSVAGKLLGLKEFIETAEEPRLKSLLEDDPHYFYKILPYAMVFGISDIWADHFKNIKMDQPEWYQSSSPGTFGMHGFVSSLTSSTSDAISTMSPSSSGGSGGYSGGGSGGGGGGSW